MFLSFQKSRSAFKKNTRAFYAHVFSDPLGEMSFSHTLSKEEVISGAVDFTEGGIVPSYEVKSRV